MTVVQGIFFNGSLQPDQEMMTQLTAELENRHQFVRETVVKVLGQIAQTRGLQESTINALIAITRRGRGDPNLFQSAIEVLSQVVLKVSESLQQDFISALQEAIQDPDRSVQQAAAYGLVQLGQNQDQLPLHQQRCMVRILLANLDSKDPYERQKSLEALGKMADHVKYFFPPLQEKAFYAITHRLSDSDQSVRAIAAESLGKLKKEIILHQTEYFQHELLTDLLKVINENTSGLVRLAGTKTLVKLSEAIIPTLPRSMQHQIMMAVVKAGMRYFYVVEVSGQLPTLLAQYLYGKIYPPIRVDDDTASSRSTLPLLCMVPWGVCLMYGLMYCLICLVYIIG